MEFVPQVETRTPGPAQAGCAVRVGSLVLLRDQEGEFEYTLVHGHESDAGHQLISIDCPLGRALLGHRAGDRVTVKAPVGQRPVIILEVI
jgi:transcription elongation factor GreA